MIRNGSESHTHSIHVVSPCSENQAPRPSNCDRVPREPGNPQKNIKHSRNQGDICISATLQLIRERRSILLSANGITCNDHTAPNLLKSSLERHSKYGKRNGEERDFRWKGVWTVFRIYDNAKKTAKGTLWLHVSSDVGAQCVHNSRSLAQNLTHSLKYIKSNKYKQGTGQKTRS